MDGAAAVAARVRSTPGCSRSTRRPRFAAGLEPRPLEETVHATLDWARSGEAPAESPAGLAREKEQQVLDAWLSKE